MARASNIFRSNDRNKYTNRPLPLSMADRLRLAALILNDIPPHAVVDDSDEWSEGSARFPAGELGIYRYPPEDEELSPVML
jgi:hypothetical protein